MKIQITLKDPDGVYESIKDAAESSTGDIEGLENDELDALAETRRETIEEQCNRWVKWGEYVTIEIDTEANTATVIPAK